MLVGEFLLPCVGPTCSLRGKRHCKSIHSFSNWSPLSYDETYILVGVVCSRITPPPSTGLSERFNWYKKDVNHILWASQSPDLTPVEPLWETCILDHMLCKHQLREYVLSEQCTSLQYSSWDLQNLFQGTEQPQEQLICFLLCFSPLYFST